MNPATPPPFDPARHPAGPPADALDRLLVDWAAPPLPDDGFTLDVLQRVARWRRRPGVQPAEAWQRLQAHQQRDARRAQFTGWGLGLGLAVAAAWLLAFSPWPATFGQWPQVLAGVAGPWAWALAAVLAGVAGAAGWATTWLD